MRDRFRHATHVVRVAMLFGVGVIGFLIARAVLIPSDFNTLGFYRAGAIDDARVRPIGFAGRAACEDCHSGTYWSDADDAQALAAADPVGDNRHSVLKCEACHGPLYFHQVAKEKEEEEDKAEQKAESQKATEAVAPQKPVPQVAADKLCLTCHQQIVGRPQFQPQVLVGDHGDNDKCDSCHRPHRPRTDEDTE